MRRTALLALLIVPAAAEDDFAQVKALVSQIGSSDERSRADAVFQLGNLGSRAKGAVPALAKALGDSSSWVSGLAYEAIRKVGPESVPSVVKALASPDENVRAGSARLLAECFARDIKPYLRQVAALVKDVDPRVRAFAAHALGQQGEAATDVLLVALAAREEGAQDAVVAGFVEIGGPAVAPLSKALATGSERVRAGAARALGEMKADGAAEGLFAALSDKSPDVASAAARALGRIGALPDKVLPRLLGELGGANGPFREACIDALAAWGEPALPGLVAALGEEGTREAAALALLKAETKGASALAETIERASPPLRTAALSTIGRFNPELVPDDAIKTIGYCLRDENPAVRIAAARALARFGRRGNDGWLKDGISHGEPEVRAATLHALAELGVDPGKTEDPDPAVAIETRLGNWKLWGAAETEDLRKIAFDATKEVRLRVAALAALGEMGLGAEGVDLAPLLGKEPVEIRRAAAQALASTTLPSVLAIREARASARPDHAVEAGLAWLAAAQDRDGEWNGNLLTAGVTGLALLAFLGANCGPDDPRYGVNVRNGLAFLLARQDKHGVLSNKDSHEYLLCHGIATLAFVEAYALTGSYRYRRAAQWALDHIAWARNPGLAWRYDPRGRENDTHITAWLLFAMRLADAAGLRVDREAYAGARTWIDRMTDRLGRTGYNSQGGAPARPEGRQETFPPDRVEAMTAAGLWCRQLLGGPSVEATVYRRGIDLVLARQPLWDPGYQDMIYWHFGALATFQDGDATWKKWSKPLFDALQAGREVTTGAWRPEDVWCDEIVGKAYATSMGVLTMLTPTRYPRDFLTKPKLSAADRAAIAALKKAQSDEDPQVREIAAAACARLGG